MNIYEYQSWNVEISNELIYCKIKSKKHTNMSGSIKMAIKSTTVVGIRVRISMNTYDKSTC